MPNRSIKCKHFVAPYKRLNQSLITEMKLTILCCTFISLASSQATPKRNAFCKKLKDLVTPFYTEEVLCKIVDDFFNMIYSGKKINQIGNDAVKILIARTPVTQYFSLLSLKGSTDKCLKPINQDTLGLLKKALPTILRELDKVYKSIQNKMNQMKKKKKRKTDVLEQGYNVATKALTKNLVQRIITASAKMVTNVEWKCAYLNLPTLISLNKYNTKRMN
uniref:Uncharacterized protein n=1 Tax=Heterorhabditis bacteriophora TaxID=37862 RepID=A0A1I7WML8_HETBA